MRQDPEQLVEAGYDQIAVPYQAWVSQVEDDPRLRYLGAVLEQLPGRPDSLDLGCGAGLPCTALLAERGRATGVDLSAAQVELARHNVPVPCLARAPGDRRGGRLPRFADGDQQS